MSSPPSQTKLEQQLLDAYGLLAIVTNQLASFLVAYTGTTDGHSPSVGPPYFCTAQLTCGVSVGGSTSPPVTGRDCCWR